MLKNILLGFLFCLAAMSNLNAQITCDFSFTQNTGCVPLSVSFCDLSVSTAGDIVAWEWDLGGVPSTVECPSRIYGLAGNYTICLTVTDEADNTCTVCNTDLIEVYELPVADFYGVEEAGCTPLDVTYFDSSTSEDGTITEWFWDFGGSCGAVIGDGTNPAATCTYDIPDAYTVSLTITDDNGCIGFVSKPDYINVSELPEVLVSANDTFDCTGNNFNVNFTNNSDVNALTFEWDFGNGDTYSGPFPPPISYDQSGSYTVTVIGTDIMSGCSNTYVLEDYINVGYPMNFSYTPESGCEDLTVAFSDDSVFPADSVVWDFGDGNTSTQNNPVHVYTDPGCYTVMFTRYVDGCVSSEFASNCIFVFEEPDVWYTNDNLIGCELPHVVNFTGGSMVATSWSWDFGDGTTSDLQNPTHFYTTYGEFPVVLTVTSPNGCTNDTLINTINVQELEASIINTNFEGCAPLEITLEDNSTSVTPITNWEWEVVDGANIYTSTDTTPTFAIADTGVYTITLIVTNTLDCTDTITVEGAVEVGIPPEVNFVADPTETCIEIPIQFTDLTPGDVDEWFWDFGNGEFSVEQNPEYFYTDTGYYDISLIVINNGCVNTISFDDYIHVMSPVASFEVINFCEEPDLRLFNNTAIDADSVFWDFGVPGSTTDTTSVYNPQFTFPGQGTYIVSQTVFNAETGCDHTTTSEVQITYPQAIFDVNPNTGCAPLTVNLIDQSIDAVEWSWSSTNGIISDVDVPNPTVTFNAPGTYTENITLIVTDINECSDTTVFSDTILVNDLIVDFTSDITTGCAPLTVQFEDISVNDWFANIVEWSWDFDGLGTSTLQNPTFTFNNIGLYTISLTATDSWGCSHTMTKTNYIDVTLPSASFIVDSLSCTDNGIPFTNTSSGASLSYSWDFGDGEFSTDENPVHAYANEGLYAVCLSITDVYGCEDSYCFNDLLIADPVASFTVDSTFASCPPLPVNFTNTSINASAYNWNFGDNSGLSTLVDPTHIYTIPGVYEVTLIASSTPTCADTLVVDDLIVLEGPEGEYSFSIDTTCAPAEITFTATSVDFYTYIWDFGTGVLDTSDTQLLSQTITFTYDEPGVYMPTLSFLNNSGCFRTLPSIGNIHVSGIDVDFLASETSLCGNDPDGVIFSIILNDTIPLTEVEWFFENGTPPSSTAFGVEVEYDAPGFHDVTFIAHNGICSDTIVKADYIKVGAVPVANFDMSQDAGCDPLLVNFTDMSSVSTGVISEWNWDFGGGVTSDLENPAHVFNAGINMPVTLEVTSDAGCRSDTFDQITVYPLVNVSAGSDVEICMGEVTQLEATIFGDTTGVDFYWTPATDLSCVNCLNPFASPNDTTTYTFVVFSPEGCQSSSEITVDVKPYAAPVIEISPDTTICANEITQIQVSAGPDVTIYSYQWDNSTPGLSCYDDCYNPVASPLENSTYVVTVTSVHGCTAIDSMSVDIVDQFQEFAGDDVVICQGDSTSLLADFGNNPFWSVSDGLTCAYCPDPIASPDTSVTYVVQVITDIGCPIIDTVVVSVVDYDEVGAGDDLVACLGDAVVINGYGEGDVVWTPSSSLSDASILNPEALPNSTTTYYLTVTNGDCIITDSVEVLVNEETVISIDDMTICEGEELALGVEGFADTYAWSPAELFSDPTAANPVVTLSETTAFSVVASLSTCEEATVGFTVNVNPTPDFYLEEMLYFLPEVPITISPRNFATGSFTYEWFPAEGLSCSDCISPTVWSPEDNTTYTLTVTDDLTGCVYITEINLVELTACSDKLVGVPNAFSPNDDGVNDRLRLIVSPTIDEVQLFQVFNRWGGLVYESTDKYGAWDGKFKGNIVQEGVYVYVLKFVCSLDNSTVTKSGDITIMR